MTKKKITLVKKGSKDIEKTIDAIVKELKGHTYSDVEYILELTIKEVKSKLTLQQF